jgi:hypothetical protein
VARSVINLVGPEGYVHGWIKVGDEAGRAAHERVTGKTGRLQSHVTTVQRNGLKAAVKTAMKSGMTPGQAKAVNQWATSRGMVRRIQAGKVSAATASNFDGAMKALPKVDGLVYRGVGNSSALADVIDSAKPGQKLNLGEPVSTSVDVKQAAGYGSYMMEIDSPAAAYLEGSASAYDYEREAVLAPGQYQVVSKTDMKLGDGRTVRVMRLQDVTAAADRSWLPALGVEAADFKPATGAALAVAGSRALNLAGGPVKTPAPQRAAGRKKLAAQGQALGDGSFPIPTVDYLKKAIRSVGRAPASKRPALKALIVKRAKQLNATNAPGVKGTWAFQGANDGAAIELAYRYKHGWIKLGGAADEHIAKAKQADAEGRHADAINHLGAAISHTTDKSAAFHLTELKKEMAARAMGVPYKAKPLPKRLHAMANDSEAIDLATPRRMPMVRGAADVQLSRTGPGTITAQHKSSGMKIGTITPQGKGYAGAHADGTATGASGGQQGALAGLIAYHNQMAAKAKAGTAAGGAKAYTAGETDAVDLAGALPYTSNASATDGPRVTSMGAGKATKAAAPASGAPSGLSAYGQGVYRKLLAKGMKPAVAAMFAKRADAMHDKTAKAA